MERQGKVRSEARRILIFDTTLRDGEQSPGCSMNTQEKLQLARQLEILGVDVIEAGFPIASPSEAEAVAAIAAEIRGATVAALCRTREIDIRAAARALRRAARPRIHVFLATSAIHLRYKLKISPDEALAQAVEGVRLAASFGAEVEFSAEDASRSDYGFLREMLQAAHEAGASILNVPDTVGYALPEEYGALFARLRQDLPGATLSAHCHDDLGFAVANSLAAVRAGATQVEVTVNGIGERAGNTSLEELAMALRVRRETLGLETGIHSEQIAATSRLLSTITGIWPQPNKAIVGRNAFAHEAGIHQHGMLNNPLTYEIMTPASVGVRDSQLVLGKHSGRHAVEGRLRGLGLDVAANAIDELTARVKELAERKKQVYDDDLLALAACAPATSARLVRYQSLAGRHLMPTATVEVEVDGERRSASAVGKGPLDAALKAADTALGFVVELLELHTRALTGGKDAVAEVMVRVRYGDVECTGTAASSDTLEASLKAYLSAVSAARRTGAAREAAA